MAVLGSTVDPRLGAVSPAAIQALSQAGAASGQMYANIGGSIAGVIKDFKDNRDDKVMAEALAGSFKGDEDPKFSPQKFRENMKGKKVSNKKIKEFISDTLQETKLQTEISNAEREAEREDAKVTLQKEQNKFLREKALREQTALESRLEADLATIAMRREEIAKNEKLSDNAKEVQLAKIKKEEEDRKKQYDLDVQEINSKKSLIQAQTEYYTSLGARNLAEASEIRTMQDSELYPGALNPASINQLAAEMGVNPDDFNAKSPVESAQILDVYIKNLGASDPNDPRIEEYVKMQKGYEDRAAGQAAFEGRSFNPNIELPYRAAQAAANAGLPALPVGGNFNGNVPGFDVPFARSESDLLGRGIDATARGISNVGSAISGAVQSIPQRMQDTRTESGMSTYLDNPFSL
tara:strand:- start:3020 stop:4243 length:1224 start_codon:yes stop_codon:yes gene_type:complete